MIAFIIILITYLLYVVCEIVYEHYKLKELRRDYDNLLDEIHKIEDVLFEDKSPNNYEQSI